MESAGIWIINENGITTYANTRMAEILGTSLDKLLGKHSFSYVYPADIAEAQRLFDMKQGGNNDRFAFRLRRADGSPVHVEVQGTPRFENGEFRGIVGTFVVNGVGS